MTRTIFKHASVIAIVLAVGQIQLNEAVLGAHFVRGVKTGTLWMGCVLAESRLFAKISRPSFLKSWFPLGEHHQQALEVPSQLKGIASEIQKKEAEIAPVVKSAVEELEPVLGSDKEAVLRLLE